MANYSWVWRLSFSHRVFTCRTSRMLRCYILRMSRALGCVGAISAARRGFMSRDHGVKSFGFFSQSPQRPAPRLGIKLVARVGVANPLAPLASGGASRAPPVRLPGGNSLFGNRWFLPQGHANLHAYGDGALAVVRHRLVPRPSAQGQ